MLPYRHVSVYHSRHFIPTLRVFGQRRNASLTSAIGHGVRKAARALEQAQQRRIKEGNLTSWEHKDDEKLKQAQLHARQRRSEEYEQRARLKWLAESTVDNQPQHVTEERELAEQNAKRNKQLRINGYDIDVPKAVPYATASSKFVYGTFAVLAALTAAKRTFHKLYIWCGEDGKLVDDAGDITKIVRQANKVGLKITRVAGGWDKMLDKMSERHPNNGVVLEAEEIPQIPALSLAPCADTSSRLKINLAPMDEAKRFQLGIPSGVKAFQLPSDRKGHRYPFLLWLDKVVDSGNMGAIFRSAFYFGVDAVILPRHGTAPLKPLMVKASAGAAELVPIVMIDNEADFMRQSQENGWLFFAAAAAESKSTKKKSKGEHTVQAPAVEHILQEKPLVLMLGNEGEGLRSFLLQQADHTVSIDSGKTTELVDSLNVSVAAALLTHRFLAAPNNAK